MELVLNQTTKNETLVQPEEIENNSKPCPFIEANTKSVSLQHLIDDTILPVFAKDNEATISHAEFIGNTQKAVEDVFVNHKISSPEIRVSHTIKGRIPSAIGKPVKELLEHEKTIYYERLAFILEVPEITKSVGKNTVRLCIGGVRAYNQENLYSKKTIEKFKVFIGFKNLVCTNLCVSTDGFKDEIRVSNPNELYQKIVELISSYNYEHHLNQMKDFTNYSLSQQQFSHLIGKLKLSQYANGDGQNAKLKFDINDKQINNVTRGYLVDSNFKGTENGDLNLFNLFNLFTGAAKSSYIDSFLQRQQQAFEFTHNLANSIKNEEPNYYLI